MKSLLCVFSMLYVVSSATVGTLNLSDTQETFSDLDRVVSVNNKTFAWPAYKVASIEGDVYLGGLFMAHERSDQFTCGKILGQPGIQAIETMLYTVDIVNNNKSMLKGFRLGVHALDDCDKDTYGLQQSVDFIRGSINNLGGTEITCPNNLEPQVNYKMITGVVGAASSINSIQVANLLKLFKIPQVSYWSTSPDLSNKERYEYFSRTVPSDYYQAQIILDIITHFNWTYISIVYEDSNYGRQGFAAFESLVRGSAICLAVTEKFPKDDMQGNEKTYDDIIQGLLKKPSAKGVIVYGSEQDAAGLMSAAKRKHLEGQFVWIGSDGWSNRQYPAENNERILEGAITVHPMASPIPEFDEYFTNLHPATNIRNPWFSEYWEEYFSCKWPNSEETPTNVYFNQECTGNEKITPTNGFEQDGQLQFIADAVLVFAHALSNMHSEYCGNVAGLCKKMQPVKGDELLPYLRKVSFKGITGDWFEFYENGDGPARYTIMNYKQISEGNFGYVKVGQYIDNLSLDMNKLQFRLEDPSYPRSSCSEPCDPGEARKTQEEGDFCCWLCVKCGKYEYLKTDYLCEPCKLGYLPNRTLNGCNEIVPVILKYDSGWVVAAIGFSLVGIALTVFTIAVFIKYNETPVVKASGRELSSVLLAGVLLCYVMTFLLVAKPTETICGSQKFLLGVCFAMIYAALVVKTNRISRIFSRRSAKRPSYISPNSQLAFTGTLVGIQVIISAALLVTSPPEAIKHFPTRETAQLVCKSAVDTTYMIGLSYPIILMVFCTVYAFKTRKIPEGFNEAKFIGFTMYTTCIIWLAFVAVFLATAGNIEVRVTAMCFVISLCAYVVLGCLFSPKIYIILLRPERNIRRGLMNSLNKKGSQANWRSEREAAAAAAAAGDTSSSTILNTSSSSNNIETRELYPSSIINQQTPESDNDVMSRFKLNSDEELKL